MKRLVTLSSFIIMSIFIGINCSIANEAIKYAAKTDNLFSNKTTDGPIGSGDEQTRRIMQRGEFERIGSGLARAGRYDDAIIQFEMGIQPGLLNHEHEKDYSLWMIRTIHERQGKIDLALKEHQWFLKANPTKQEYLDKERELKALIKARDTASHQPIYEHINYLRKMYKKYIPPKSKGDSGFHQGPINDIIHLYDFMGDADGGIKFMQEVLSSRSIYPNERKEYEAVLSAFRDDKRSGQGHHLQNVIKTATVISW